jgi:hypothetical protein
VQLIDPSFRLRSELSHNEEDEQKELSLVRPVKNWRMVRGTGFEPLDSTLQQQALAGQGTQGGTQIPSDPILARLVVTWPNLSDERKKIIGSLLD